jgi:aldose 1-epimerase
LALLRLAVGDDVVEVDPAVGGRLVSWRVGDLELLGGRSQIPEEYGCYPMAPWPGRLRDNSVSVDGSPHALPVTYDGWAMHGTVLDRPWRMQEATATSVTLTTDLGPSWPWTGQVTLTWRLGPGCLSSRLQVTSDGARFPADLGWHPWFRRHLARGRGLTWNANATAMLERGSDLLPTGRRLDPSLAPGPYDDAFEVPDGVVVMEWPGALHMTCVSDTRWVVVFDALDGVVCIEPQTGPTDALNTGTDLVGPDAPKSAAVTWTWVPIEH